jgi:putative hydrolase of the HAD superfamily
MFDAPQALVLDFGGVVSRTLFETHALTETELDLPKNSLTWQGPFAPETDALWQSMQADEITERAYWHQRTLEVAALTGNNWTQMSEFVRAARGADPDPIIRPEARAAIDIAHRAGIKLAILSNELDLFYGPSFRKKLPFLSLFHAVIDATYTHILKPDARAYQYCLDALNLPASACVFVDDQERNVQGAAAIGMKTVHFDVRAPQNGFADALHQLGLTMETSL